MLKSPDGLLAISASRAMNLKQTKLRSNDFDIAADEALRAARDMPPGPERIEALEAAGMLRNVADVFGVVFTKRDPLSR